MATLIQYAMTYLNTRDEEGQGLVEYGLIIAGVAIVCIAAVWALGGEVSGLLESLSFDGTTPGT